MTWFKVDDGFSGHPKVVACSLAARGLWVTAGAWAAQQLTDGHVPEAALTLLTGLPLGKARVLAGELYLAGLWEQESDGWRFHDWATHQPTKVAVLSRREERREAGSRGGSKGNCIRWHGPSCGCWRPRSASANASAIADDQVIPY